MNPYDESRGLTTICESRVRLSLLVSEGLVPCLRLSQVLETKRPQAAGSRNHWSRWRRIPDNVVGTSSPSGDSGDGSGFPHKREEVVLCEHERSEQPQEGKRFRVSLKSSSGSMSGLEHGPFWGSVNESAASRFAGRIVTLLF